MYKVMIVEDSKPILRNIKSQVESADRRLHVTHTAFNGSDALSMLERERVDIVFTDIRMPKMDGLTFIARAREMRPDIRYFVLSGFDDFEYARQAIKLHVCEYLLKPLDSLELNVVLQRTIRELEDERKDEERKEISRLFHPYAASTDSQRSFRSAYYAMIVVRNGYLKSSEPVWDGDRLLAACHRTFPEAFCLVADTPAASEKAVLVGWDNERTAGDWNDRIEEMTTALREDVPEAHVTWSALESDPSRIQPLYADLSSCLDDHISLAGAAICMPAARRKPAAVQLSGPSDSQPLRLASLIRQGQRERFAVELARWMNRCELEAEAIGKLRQMLKELADAMKSQLAAKLQPLIPSEGELDGIVRSSSSYAKLAQRLTDRLVPLFDALLNGRVSSRETFDAIEAYGKAHMSKPFSLQELCRDLAYSPSYLIRIVKRFAGVTPVEYFRQLKIKQARQLIMDNELLLVKEIADALGFSDQHYFCKVFKQYSGCSPSEYRKRLRDAAQADGNPPLSHV